MTVILKLGCLTWIKFPQALFPVSVKQNKAKNNVAGVAQ